MHEENTVSLKVYLFEGTNTVEVRRFEVDQSVITNYDYIRERLQVVIPKLRGKVFKLLWQDAEGDEITISSDEELMIALSELKTNVMKFIVRLQSESGGGEEPQLSIHIPNLHNLYSLLSSFTESCPMFAETQSDDVCNGCQQPLPDVRYRCLECVQYNLCAECEHKNLHPEHVMLRYSNTSTIGSWVPKCAQMLKSQFIHGARCAGSNTNSYFREKMSQHYSEKEKCGHHKKRFRKHWHSSASGDAKQAPQEESAPECPFSGPTPGNIGNIISSFLGVYNDALKKHMETEAAAGQTPNKTTDNSSVNSADMDIGSPMATNVNNDKDMKEQEAAASSSSANPQKDSKINMALELLAEMGFNDDNKWLTKLLEHFGGDIAKALDYLTLDK